MILLELDRQLSASFVVSRKDRFFRSCTVLGLNSGNFISSHKITPVTKISSLELLSVESKRKQ